MLEMSYNRDARAMRGSPCFFRKFFSNTYTHNRTWNRSSKRPSCSGSSARQNIASRSSQSQSDRCTLPWAFFL